MPQGKKGRGRSPEKGSQQVATYFLAKKSGLFTPGMATILANIPIVNSTKPVLGLRTQGQKSSGGGGGSGGVPSIGLWILMLGTWNDNGVWDDNANWIG